MDVCLALLIGAPGLLAAILALAGLLWLAGAARAKDRAPGNTEASAMATNAIKSLSRSEIRQKLKKLSETPPPKDLKPGACCYDMAGPPNRAEYVCPKCGEKTLYTNAVAMAVGWELPTARRTLKEVQKLSGPGIALDESQFCRKCSPTITDPKLVLQIFYDSGQPHTVVGMSSRDLQLLQEFFRGTFVHDEGPRGEVPLKNYEKRLQELLGANK